MPEKCFLLLLQEISLFSSPSFHHLVYPVDQICAVLKSQIREIHGCNGYSTKRPPALCTCKALSVDSTSCLSFLSCLTCLVLSHVVLSKPCVVSFLSRFVLSFKQSAFIFLPLLPHLNITTMQAPRASILIVNGKNLLLIWMSTVTQ